MSGMGVIGVTWRGGIGEYTNCGGYELYCHVSRYNWADGNKESLPSRAP